MNLNESSDSVNLNLKPPHAAKVSSSCAYRDKTDANWKSWFLPHRSIWLLKCNMCFDGIDGDEAVREAAVHSAILSQNLDLSTRLRSSVYECNGCMVENFPKIIFCVFAKIWKSCERERSLNSGSLDPSV